MMAATLSLPRGLLNGIVDPLGDDEEAKRRRAMAMFPGLGGLLGGGVTFDPAMHAAENQGGPLDGGPPPRGLLAPPEQHEPRLPDSTSQPREIDPEVQRLLGEAPKKPKDWQKVLGAVIGGLGAVAAADSGHEWLARENLKNALDAVGGWGFKDKQATWQDRQRIASLPGMTQREMAAYLADPKGWGGHMADAYSTHHAAANLNPGDQRVFGNPNAGGSVYQAPTSADQYARSLGLKPGTPAYDMALKDYTLRANGPTAFEYDQQLDDYRTGNDIRLEGARQGNRMQLRGTPTYRQANPAPSRQSAPRRSGGGSAPRVPSATGPNGQKIYFTRGKWVDERGRAVR